MNQEYHELIQGIKRDKIQWYLLLAAWGVTLAMAFAMWWIADPEPRPAGDRGYNEIEFV